MTKYTIFPNAPIVEAVLDIQVDQPERVTLEMLDSIYDIIKDRFPLKEQRKKSQAGPDGSQKDSPHQDAAQ